ncbi:hypothetical protein I4F81_002924 [Pyropia yezoensis]|uniref:Uncharacterized protein n=1 Tax=Pyropia yezoensis TaxID=2788 RepID=A0ACC3BQX0_PYRYE|nr:hypothetical protein I4F81_002924 [Neopyropia yezoensis]
MCDEFLISFMNSLYPEQIRTLAGQRENQPIVAREDGCLSALISFLVPSTPALAAVAVDALVSLSSHPSNRDLLRDEGDLFAALHALIVDDSSPVPLRRSVLTILEELVDDDDGEEVTELHALGYLDEGGQRLKDAERRARKKKKAVNAGASSLAARLDEQRKADARKRAKQERLLERVGRGVGGGAPAATTASSGGGFWRIW